MPHLRLYVPEEWLRDEFQRTTGFDAKRLLDHLVKIVAGLRMENPAVGASTREVPMINLSNLKHAIVPLHHAHVGGDAGRVDGDRDGSGRRPFDLVLAGRRDAVNPRLVAGGCNRPVVP